MFMFLFEIKWRILFNYTYKQKSGNSVFALILISTRRLARKNVMHFQYNMNVKYFANKHSVLQLFFCILLKFCKDIS